MGVAVARGAIRLVACKTEFGKSANVCAANLGTPSPCSAHWVQRFREEGGEVAPALSVPPASNAEVPVRWMEAVVEERAATVVTEPRGLCVRLPGGAEMEIEAPGQMKLAAQLLRALAEGPRSC